MLPGQTGAPMVPGALPPDNGVPAGPSAAPLRRLTTREYHNTVRDLFKGAEIPAQGFPPPTAVNGFENHELSLPATSLLTESELDAAAAIAERVVAQRDKWVACTGDDIDCARATADALIARAYRRPPTTAERDRMRGFVDETFEASDFASTLSDVVQVVLASPQFLYRIETGKAPAGDAMWVDLDDYELASRLSYFLWETMPDEMLFDDAAAGRLSDGATLKSHAERMLNDDGTKVTHRVIAAPARPPPSAPNGAGLRKPARKPTNCVTRISGPGVVSARPRPSIISRAVSQPCVSTACCAL